jgi:hypothetical protein
MRTKPVIQTDRLEVSSKRYTGVSFVRYDEIANAYLAAQQIGLLLSGCGISDV